MVPIKIRRWFPPGDPIAAAVATLCILREDFFLELRGIISDEVVPLDVNESAYRRTYFWRNSLRTLEEIRAALNALNRLPAFRDAMAQDASGINRTFAVARDALNRASGRFLRELRNTVGGHFDLRRVQAGLDSLDIRQPGFVQLSNIREHLHYNFTTEIVWAAIMRDSPNTVTMAEIEKVLGDTAPLMTAFAAMDDVIAWYVRERRLAQ